MQFNYTYLDDADFLLKVDNLIYQEIHVKVTCLDWNENPIKDIEGYASAGTLSLNGDSAVRRTGSLTMIVPTEQDAEIAEMNSMFSIDKKIYLQIGITNSTGEYTEYPILWFPQGLFITSGVSLTHSLSAVSINLQLKDKMCLLNGDVGGTINASTQFDEYETIDENGDWIIEKPTIEQMVREGINHFGKEQLGKIIIEDIPSRIKMVMKWLGNCPLYLVNDSESYSFTTDYSVIPSSATYQTYYYGEDIGYTYTDFTYPSELIENAGSSVVTFLDKVKNTLGNYEYFYDVFGNVRFREKKNYLNTTYTTEVLQNMLTDADYVVDMSQGMNAYDFRDSKTTISYSNAPQFNKIKNDYVIWGVREGVTGISYPIRYHLVIDTKPEIGNIYEVFFYEDPDDSLIKAKAPVRYSSYSALSEKGAAGVFYLTEDTGKIYKYQTGEYVELEDVKLEKVETTDWRSELYLQGVVAEPLGLFSNDYYIELNSEWPKLYDLKKSSYEKDGETIYTGGFLDDVLKDPSSIDYFLDFIDSTAAISKLSVSNIGRRSHVESKNDINCIFAPTIPDFVLIENGQTTTEELREEAENQGQSYIQVDSSIYKTIGTGGAAFDAYTEVKTLLYDCTQYNESIQMTMMPIYTLEPNTRITVEDKLSNINGDFVIKTINMPLTPSSNMTISATRAVDKF